MGSIFPQTTALALSHREVVRTIIYCTAGYRQGVGFSESERVGLARFFGRASLLEDIVQRGVSVSVPSAALSPDVSRDILTRAGVASFQIVPLISDGRGMGVMMIGATQTDVTSDDSVAFARAMGNQVVQSLELARSVARLAASERRYRTLLNNANDYIAVLTPDGIVREMNQRWVELTALPYEQLIGRHVREFAPTGKEEESDRMFRTSTELSTPALPIEVAAPNGSKVLMEFSRTYVDVAGEKLVLTIGRDVTQQRLLEEQLRQSPG